MSASRIDLGDYERQFKDELTERLKEIKPDTKSDQHVSFRIDDHGVTLVPKHKRVDPTIQQAVEETMGKLPPPPALKVGQLEAGTNNIDPDQFIDVWLIPYPATTKCIRCSADQAVRIVGGDIYEDEDQVGKVFLAGCIPTPAVWHCLKCGTEW